MTIYLVVAVLAPGADVLAGFSINSCRSEGVPAAVPSASNISVLPVTKISYIVLCCIVLYIICCIVLTLCIVHW